MIGEKKIFDFNRFYRSGLSPALNNISQKYFELPRLEGGEKNNNQAWKSLLLWTLPSIAHLIRR